MSIDENSPTPLYRQVEEAILQLIDNGEYKPGTKIPTEGELCERFGVSRVTVRKALGPLADKGVLERRTGKGTFVAEKRLSRSLSTVMSFSDMCRMQGCHPGARTLRLDLTEPEDDDLKRLRLSDDTEHILLLQRLRYVDSMPVMIETTKFPESFIFLMDEDLDDSSLYELLAKHDIRMTFSRKMLDIKLANYKESKYLKVPDRHPLLRIDSAAESADGRFVHLTHQLCVADRFKLYI